MAETFFFEGFESPAFTMIPNQLLDELMVRLNEAELKVTLYICRRTFGFQRDSDDISIKQIMEGITTKDGRRLDSGIGMSRSPVIRALQQLQVKGVIIGKKNSHPERGSLPTTYRLRMKSDPKAITPVDE